MLSYKKGKCDRPKQRLRRSANQVGPLRRPSCEVLFTTRQYSVASSINCFSGQAIADTTGGQIKSKAPTHRAALALAEGLYSYAMRSSTMHSTRNGPMGRSVHSH